MYLEAGGLQFGLNWLTHACLQVLFSELGFVYLDVRPPLELDEVGKVRGSVNVPIMFSQRKWSPEEQKKVVKKVWSALLPSSSCLTTDWWSSDSPGEADESRLKALHYFAAIFCTVYIPGQTP